MNKECGHCGLKYEREPGFFLGSIYLNYGLTSVLMTAGYFAMFFTDTLTDPQRLTVLVIFTVIFPILFFRYARALWIGFDFLIDPRKAKVVGENSIQVDQRSDKITLESGCQGKKI